MAFVFVLCASLLATPLAATTVQQFDLAGLATNAERIVVGVCREAKPQLVHGQIYTHYLFNINESIKGPAVSELELHLPGGNFQGVINRIAGMPVFTPGEEAVLFLSAANELGHAWPIGLAQGHFAIVRSDSSAPRVFQELDGLSLYADLSAAKKTRLPDPVQGMPLDPFLARVRAMANPKSETQDAR